MELKLELTQANERLADMYDNQRILRKLKAIENDDRLLERIAEVEHGSERGTNYRFEQPEDGVLLNE